MMSGECAFALYHIPGSDHFSFISGDAEELKETGFIQKKGFILHPFDIDSESPVFVIPSNDVQELSIHEVENMNLSSDHLFSKGDLEIEFEKEDDYKSYFKRISKFISEMNADKIQKAILSRIHIRYKRLDNPLHLLVNLAKKYPQAFVYLVHIPGKETWMGASPETLIKLDNDRLQTVSVAATKSVDEDREWTPKEFEEQLIVTQYIENIFQNNNMRLTKEGPSDYIAGNLLHLKTFFDVELADNPFLIEKIIAELHPTPAVCGFPKDHSKALITSTESHKRKYYAGYLGPVNIESKTHLFVNIRCMKLLADRQILYIGGGITKLSEPDKEWNETIIKSQTLLDVLDNIS
ncbi:MAG: chorismate-binding protein [Bacteroidales bacterium]|nr:chorismate-binding protein [Bacteroidales bacterium]